MNVDLDVWSSQDLRPLTVAMEPHVFSFRRPPGEASFEVNDPAPSDPEVVMREFIRIVKSLPPTARAAWNAASKRVFDVGLRSGRLPPSRSYSIGAKTLREAADLKADLVITLYAVDPEEDGSDEPSSPPSKKRKKRKTQRVFRQVRQKQRT
jgi:hypothetical protein